MGGSDGTKGGLFVVLCLVVAVFAQVFMQKTPLPFTIIMLLCGLVLGFIIESGECVSSSASDACAGLLKTECLHGKHSQDCDWDGLLQLMSTSNSTDPQHGSSVYGTAEVWTNIEPHFIMYAFLPALIYASSSSMNFHVFQKSISMIMTLALPGVLIATFLTAFMVGFMQPSGYNWSFMACLTIGSMLSATDPVAVVALLKESNAPSNLAMVIEGESLFNDGTAFAIFLITYEAMQGHERDALECTLFFFQLAGGGILLGWIMGVGMVYMIHHTQDGLLECIITLVGSYGAFILAEELHVSGVLTVVVLGLEMARSGKPVMTDVHMMHHFWELMEFIANSVIFGICGLHIAAAMLSVTSGQNMGLEDVGFMFIIYFIIVIVRFIVTVALAPLYCWTGYGIRTSEGFVIAWAGLRGAVSLTIASIVGRTEADLFCCESTLTSGCSNATECTWNGDPTQQGNSPENLALLKVFESKILFHCAGVTFLTLIVNGSTTGKVISWLKLGLQSRAAQYTFDRFCRELSQQIEKKLKELSKHPFFEHMDEHQVWDLLPVFNDEMLFERFRDNKINAARFNMINVSPFFKQLRIRYGITDEANEQSKMPDGLSGNAKMLLQTRLNRQETASSVNFQLDRARFPFTNWSALEATGKEMVSSFVTAYWPQVVEMRRRALNILEAIYWHHFEEGWTTEAGIGALIETVAATMDRQRRASAKAPPPEVQGEFTINSWVYMHKQLQPQCITRIARRLLEAVGLSWISRKVLHYAFERIIDLANSYNLANEKLAHRLDKLAMAAWKDQNLKISGTQHNLNPLVLQMVAMEAREAAKEGRELIQEILRTGSKDLMQSVATKQAIRHLLSGITTTLEHELHNGHLDTTEGDMIKTCVKKCQWRLRMGEIVSKPPSIVSLLQPVSFFRRLPVDTLKAIAGVSQERHLSSGNILFKQGNQRSKGFYLIVAGSVALYRAADMAVVVKRLMTGKAHEGQLKGKLNQIKEGKQAKTDPSSHRGRISTGIGSVVDITKQAKKALKLKTVMSSRILRTNPNSDNSSGSNMPRSFSFRFGKKLKKVITNNGLLGCCSCLTGQKHYVTAVATSMVVTIFVPISVLSKLSRKLDTYFVMPNSILVGKKIAMKMVKERQASRIRKRSSRRASGIGEWALPQNLRDLNQLNKPGSAATAKKDAGEDDDDDELYRRPKTKRLTRSTSVSAAYELSETNSQIVFQEFAKVAASDIARSVMFQELQEYYYSRPPVPLDLYAQIMKIIRNGQFVRLPEEEKIRLRQPCILLTGNMKCNSNLRLYEGPVFIVKPGLFTTKVNKKKQIVNLLILRERPFVAKAMFRDAISKIRRTTDHVKEMKKVSAHRGEDSDCEDDDGDGQAKEDESSQLSLSIGGPVSHKSDGKSRPVTNSRNATTPKVMPISAAYDNNSGYNSH